MLAEGRLHPQDGGGTGLWLRSRRELRADDTLQIRLRCRLVLSCDHYVWHVPAKLGGLGADLRDQVLTLLPLHASLHRGNHGGVLDAVLQGLLWGAFEEIVLRAGDEGHALTCAHMLQSAGLHHVPLALPLPVLAGDHPRTPDLRVPEREEPDREEGHELRVRVEGPELLPHELRHLRNGKSLVVNVDL